VCAHTPVAVKRVDSFGDFDILYSGDLQGQIDVGGGCREVAERECNDSMIQKFRWTKGSAEISGLAHA
jgi:hypothetical protein